MAAITTPHCRLFAANLVWPVGGFLVLSVTFDQNAVRGMRDILRSTLQAEYGAIGRRAALPLTNLADGRWLMRFMSQELPSVVSELGLKLIVQPAIGSVLRIDAYLQPMRSSVGLMPIMRRVIVVGFAPQAEH